MLTLNDIRNGVLLLQDGDTLLLHETDEGKFYVSVENREFPDGPVCSKEAYLSELNKWGTTIIDPNSPKGE